MSYPCLAFLARSALRQLERTSLHFVLRDLISNHYLLCARPRCPRDLLLTEVTSRSDHTAPSTARGQPRNRTRSCCSSHHRPAAVQLTNQVIFLASGVIKECLAKR